MSEPQPWERQPGESSRAFAAFEVYRSLLPGERSLQQAWRIHKAASGKGGDATSASAGKPHGHWTRWMKQWRWQARAEAYDDDLLSRAREEARDRELQARAADQAEELRQRQLRKEEARAARTVSRRLLRRLLELIDRGQLERMGMLDLLPHLQKICKVLEVGQRLDPEPPPEYEEMLEWEADRRELIGKIVALMRKFCPPERWEELGQQLNALRTQQPPPES